MQGGWAGAEQASPAPSQALGAKGFLPWASGAAGGGGGGGMQRGIGAYPPPMPRGASRPSVGGQDSPQGSSGPAPRAK